MTAVEVFKVIIASFLTRFSQLDELVDTRRPLCGKRVNEFTVLIPYQRTTRFWGFFGCITKVEYYDLYITQHTCKFTERN